MQVSTTRVLAIAWGLAAAFSGPASAGPNLCVVKIECNCQPSHAGFPALANSMMLYPLLSALRQSDPKLPLTFGAVQTIGDNWKLEPFGPDTPEPEIMSSIASDDAGTLYIARPDALYRLAPDGHVFQRLATARQFGKFRQFRDIARVARRNRLLIADGNGLWALADGTLEKLPIVVGEKEGRSKLIDLPGAGVTLVHWVSVQGIHQSSSSVAVLTDDDKMHALLSLASDDYVLSAAVVEGTRPSLLLMTARGTYLISPRDALANWDNVTVTRLESFWNSRLPDNPKGADALVSEALGNLVVYGKRQYLGGWWTASSPTFQWLQESELTPIPGPTLSFRSGLRFRDISFLKTVAFVSKDGIAEINSDGLRLVPGGAPADVGEFPRITVLNSVRRAFVNGPGVLFEFTSDHRLTPIPLPRDLKASDIISLGEMPSSQTVIILTSDGVYFLNNDNTLVHVDGEHPRAAPTSQAVSIPARAALLFSDATDYYAVVDMDRSPAAPCAKGRPSQ